MTTLPTRLTPPDLNQPDLARLRRAARNVIAAAVAEADAFRKIAERRTDGPIRDLHDTHLDELDAIQALGAALDLFERHVAGKPTEA